MSSLAEAKPANFRISGKRVFVTGGAGFIGRRLVDKLCELQPSSVFIYDDLIEQVHGENPLFPEYTALVTCVKASTLDKEKMEAYLQDCDPDIIIHLAAETGTGQSQDEIVRYCDTNVGGTANLLRAVSKLPRRCRDFLLSSSRAVYGEGPHTTLQGDSALPIPRRPEAMDAGDFNVYSADGEILIGAAVTTGARVQPLSVYASTKLMQEHLLQNVAAAMSLNAKILRFQNVYGPGQSLRNPYTGVLSIFAAKILLGQTLDIFEDGQMVRDFVFVDDVVEACLAALNYEGLIPHPLDIGSGYRTTILQATEQLVSHLGNEDSRIHISGNYRLGDIRSAYADITNAEKFIKWQPKVGIEKGISRLSDWAKSRQIQRYIE